MTKDSQKLQKVLADLGLGSRRQMEKWIDAGRIFVDGKRAHQGQRVTIDAQIEVDGNKVRNLEAVRNTRILAMNKKAGEIVARRDPENRPTVFANLPKLANGRWISIGRLDISTSGLLLFTNHGLIAHRLMHPSSVIDREYAVRVMGKLSEQQLETLKIGALIDDSWCRFSDIRYYNGSGLNHWYHVVLMEGRNRQIHRLLDHVGSRVSRIKRVRFGPVILPKTMPAGKIRELDTRDVQAICKWIDVAPIIKLDSDSTMREKGSLLIPYPGLDVRGHVYTQV
ncbi:MAG: pseudouridine synthase [Gammaproteobacteria bacterium]|nr:pseudouridine synthase [Gammaproteobacteria bacterium]